MATQSSSDPPPCSTLESCLGLRRNDQLFLGGLLIILTLLLGIYWGRLNGWFNTAPAPVQIADDYQYTLDINSATWMEWAQLDGIGETLARRIVQDRKDRGPFQDVDDVIRVKGIGGKTLARMRQHLKCEKAPVVESTP